MTPGSAAETCHVGAFGGWVLDGFEISIVDLVMAPALTELLPNSRYEANTTTLGYFGQLGVAAGLPDSPP